MVVKRESVVCGSEWCSYHDSPISSTIYAPAIPTIADEFGKSIEAINLTVTMYL